VSKNRALRSAASGSLALVATLGGFALAPQPSKHAALPVAEPASHAEPDALDQPAGFRPATIQAAYGLSTSPYAGVGQTIAIVDAFDNAKVTDDLAVFDTYWGLPVCGSACFTKVDQNGGTDYPSPAPLNWAVEIAMDVEWAHAIAPGAHIVLVEASSSSLSDLLAAERYAGAHAAYVSNSWGYPEFSGETADAGTFSDPGVSYFAAVDDSAGQTQYPATSPNVVAVGGNELTPLGTIPWTSGGGGCSAYELASSVGARVAASQAGCSSNQSTPEVSADAVGTPVFDTVSGWLTAGGTSFATVLWTAAAADSGQLVTNDAISSGSIPLHPVIGGTLLRTGLGDLGAIPRSRQQFVNVDLAEIEHTV
jgi:subtilase family serine protease